MNYRNNNGDGDLSILGFGCMRFPKSGNSFDLDEIVKELGYAIDNGVNYFDTAYIYPGNEEILGRALEIDGRRDFIKIATKLPHYLMKTREEMDRRFNEQLKRLKTDHVDYYLMHMLPDLKTWRELISRGVLDFINENKALGRIRHIGFSYHGSSNTFIELLNAYDWDFCQVQYNYMDENSQAGRRGVIAAAEKRIPVIIMEPLRGGRLSNALPKNAREIFAKRTPERSPAQWAFKWLWDQPEVSVVLSGMNSMAMLEENIKAASESMPGEFTDEDFKMFEEVKARINAKIKVPCTGCAYCMPCPNGVDIPGCFRTYNESYTDNYKVGFQEYMMCTTMKQIRSNASLCIGCGKCEQHCPQSISIRDDLKKVKKRYENIIYKVAVLFLKKK